MLLALIFHGVAFEFRFRARRFRRLWDLAFSGGSALAGFCQGIVLGAFIDGIRVEGDAFAGGTFDFVSPFSILCGFGVVAGYALLGATWLILRTDGTTSRYGRAATGPALWMTLAFIAAVSVWTPINHAEIAQRWFSWPNIAWLSPVPILTAVTAIGIWRSIEGPHEARPLLLSIALFLLAFFGLSISLWPYAVPYSATLWQAASSPPTLVFVGVGTAVIVPIVLAYMSFAHWVFRGKLGAENGYGG